MTMSLSQRFTRFTAIDGTTSEVTITINGADDPSEITVGEGDSDMGEVTEDVDVDPESNDLMATGTLTITDVDANDVAAFQPNGTFNPEGSTNDTALGMLTITDDGEWTYVVDNDNVQYLDDDEFVTEVYTVTAIDGTTSEVTITINGADDPSEITVGEGDSDMGEVTEDVDVDPESNDLMATGNTDDYRWLMLTMSRLFNLTERLILKVRPMIPRWVC